VYECSSSVICKCAYIRTGRQTKPVQYPNEIQLIMHYVSFVDDV